MTASTICSHNFATWNASGQPVIVADGAFGTVGSRQGDRSPRVYICCTAADMYTLQKYLRMLKDQLRNSNSFGAESSHTLVKQDIRRLRHVSLWLKDKDASIILRRSLFSLVCWNHVPDGHFAAPFKLPFPQEYRSAQFATIWMQQDPIYPVHGSYSNACDDIAGGSYGCQHCWFANPETGGNSPTDSSARTQFPNSWHRWLLARASGHTALFQTNEPA